jgi:predicted dehydrogenase
MSLGVAVVGAGVMGQRHARVLTELESTTVPIVCDVIADNAQRLAEAIGAEWTTQIEEAVTHSQVSAVCVCVSDAEHKAVSLLAASHGKPLFIEKPLATTLDDCDAIIDAVSAAGIPAMVGHVLRFEPRYSSIKRIIEDGGIGEMSTIATHRIQSIAAQDRLQGRCSLPLFLGVHEYDIQRWLVGSDAVSITARAKWGVLSSQGHNVEDASFALIEFANGVLGAVELGWILPRGHYASDSRVDIVGSAGAVTLSGMEGGLIHADTERTRSVDTVMSPSYHDHRFGAFAYEMMLFADMITASKPSPCSLTDAREAVRMALAVEESARTGATVEFVGASN